MVRCTNTIVHISRLGVAPCVVAEASLAACVAICVAPSVVAEASLAACVVAEASVCDGRRWDERLESFACELAFFHQRIASLLDERLFVTIVQPTSRKIRQSSLQILNTSERRGVTIDRAFTC